MLHAAALSDHKAFQVEYAFQDIEDIPENGSIPEGRVKPRGTAHAVYCCRKYVNEPFAVINSDDFYGAEAFKCLADYLRKSDASAMAAKPKWRATMW